MALLALGLAGCPSSPYRCDPTHTCASPAVCAPTGYCAVASTLCASGLRYTVSAAEPDVCVPLSAPVDAPSDTLDDVASDTASDADIDAPDAADGAGFDAFEEGDVDDAVDAGDVLDESDALDASDVFDGSIDALDAAIDRPDVFDATDVSDARPTTDALVDGGATRCVAVPRQLSPIAATRFGGGQVTLVWRNLSMATVTEVQVARDPAFTSLVAMTTGAGAGDARAMLGGLTRGVYFWRVRSTCSGDGSASDWSPGWSFWLSGTGRSVGSIGWLRDLNGDGRSDLVVGTPRTPSTYAGGRLVEVYFGASGTTPFGGAPGLSLGGSVDGFGAQAAIVPDMNGDGRAELAVSGCKRGGVCSPQVTIYTLAPSSRTFSVLASIGIGGTSQRFGADLAGLGDVDGDGYGDLMIAAPGEHPTPVGQVYVVRGGATPTIDMTLGPPVVADTPAVARFGWSVAGVGDVTADGVPDALVTSFERAWIYPGRASAGALFGAPMQMRLTATEEGTFGYVAAPAGDTNSDGVADFALARPGAMSGLGDVATYLGAPDFSAGRVPDTLTLGLRSGGRFGQSLAGGGNFAGGLDDDLIVGAPNANGGRGEVYALIDRRPIGASTLQILMGAVPLPNFGRSASIIGDFDGDGIDEFAFGAGQDAAMATTFSSGVYTWRGSVTVVPVPTGGNTVTGTSDYGYSLGER